MSALSNIILHLCYQQAEIQKDAAKSKARQYLEPLVSQVEDPYELAILTYALETVGSNKRNDAYLKLDKIKRTSKSDCISLVTLHATPRYCLSNQIRFVL